MASVSNNHSPTITKQERSFEDIFKFLAKYHWIHTPQLTKFFQTGVHNDIPPDWTETFSRLSLEQLNRFPFFDNLHHLDSCTSSAIHRMNHEITVSNTTTTTTSITDLSDVRYPASLTDLSDVRYPASLTDLSDVRYPASLTDLSDVKYPASLTDFLQKCRKLYHDHYHHPQQTHNQQCGGAGEEGIVSWCSLPVDVDKELRKGMSPKKLHEVERMASLVHQVALKSGCNVIIDVGSGLGYLGQVLHKNYGLTVIGLESCVGHQEKAEKRAARQGLSCSAVQNVPFFITDDEESVSRFSDLINDIVSSTQPCHHTRRNCHDNGDNNIIIQPSSNQEEEDDVPCQTAPGKLPSLPSNVRACLIGLHCCGDLTPAMMRLYARLHFLRAFCCVSCCYHKMQTKPGSENFANFPMSAAAVSAYNSTCGTTTMSPPPPSSSSSSQSSSQSSPSSLPLSSQSSSSSPSPSSSSSSSSSPEQMEKEGGKKAEKPAMLFTPCSLRLAAQETRLRWESQSGEDHERHMRRVAYRAVLETFLEDRSQEQMDRLVVRKLDYSSFTAFIQSYLSSATNLSDAEKLTVGKKLRELYDRFEPAFHTIQPFTCCQTMLQPVLEGLIMEDRCQWLVESGCPSSTLLPVFDDRLSPRCLALVSFKPPSST